MKKDLIKQGTILISKPSLGSDVFSKSIILITEHNDFGSIGFVLNKPTKFQVKDLLPDIFLDNPIFEGGPVEQDKLFYIHKFDKISNNEPVVNNIYWNGSLDEIYDRITNNDNRQIKFFIGYSGWSSGQLMKEIENNFWTVINDYSFDPFKINETNDWKKQMTNMGGDNLIWANMPDNPLLN